jgi:hypothetical protein
VTDDETSETVAGAQVWAEFVVPPMRVESLSVTTDDRGRARFPAEPAESIHGITVSAAGYARKPSDVSAYREEGHPNEYRIRLGKPAVVEVIVVLPDERRAALSVQEGEDFEPAPAGLARMIEPRRLKVPLQWADDPPALPEHNPLMILRFDSSPHRGKTGVIHRVTHAQTAAGKELPVFRDAAPADAQTFGLYDIGRNGFGSTVFVIGTLEDARAAEAADAESQWTRNARVLGPASRPAGRNE